MSDLNTCDCCGKEEQSIDLFWNVHWEEHTPRQLSVLGKMQDEGYEAVCSDCFYELLEEDLYA